MLLAPEGGRIAVAPGKSPLVDVQTALARQDRVADVRTPLAGREAGATIERLLSPLGRDQDRDAVLVRFVEPPRKVLEALQRAGIRQSFGRRHGTRDVAKMNHVLLAGSKSTQTCADARIDNDFHGAFSYYLCQTIRKSGAELEHQDFIRSLRQILRTSISRRCPNWSRRTHGARFSVGDRRRRSRRYNPP